VKVDVLMVEASIASLKVARTFVLIGTVVEALAGDVESTAGVTLGEFEAEDEGCTRTA